MGLVHGKFYGEWQASHFSLGFCKADDLGRRCFAQVVSFCSVFRLDFRQTVRTSLCQCPSITALQQPRDAVHDVKL